MRLDQYDIKEEIGQGPRSVVYRAYQRNLGLPVALKVLRRYDDASKRKFHQEATITANLGHEGIRKVLGAEQMEYDGQPLWCVAMEYVDYSLRSMLGRPMEVKKAANIGAQIADVLHYVHQQGLVHLDVKPSNILIFKDGRAVLSDFGIARRIGERTTDGTPRYLSPEQARGESVWPASDVYSLGAALYEMLTGRPPYRADNDLALIRKHADPSVRPVPPRKLNPQLSREAERVILKAMAKNLDERYATAAELADDLRELEQGRTTTNITSIFMQVPRPVWFVTVLIPILLVLVWQAPNLLPIIRPLTTPTATVPLPPPTASATATATEDLKPTATHTATSESSLPPTVTLESTPTPATPTPTPVPLTATPEDPCPDSRAKITSPREGSTVTGVVEVTGSASIPNFWKWKLEWATADTEDWRSIITEQTHQVDGGFLANWDTSVLPEPGRYRLKLTIADITGNYPAENVCEVLVDVEQ